MNQVEFPAELKGVHFHFVGIKGTGMVALVEILHARGALITGSDVSERFYTDEILDKLSIKAEPFSEKNIDDSVQFVVYSSAYNPRTNPDLAQAIRRKIPVMLYSEALGAVSRTAYSAGICGVHGKTTTTGMAGTLLSYTDLPSQALAGSIISSFGSSCTMTNLSSNQKSDRKYFVAETCEYQRNFMHYEPSKIVLTAVESDHQDYYPTFKDIQNAFVDYICKLPKGGQLIYCADDEGALQTAQFALARRNDIVLVPYGQNAQGAYKLTFGQVKGGKHYFTIDCAGECAICVPGDHNVRNACAAFALVFELLRLDGKNPLDYVQRLKEGLLAFSGGKRRSEIVGRTQTPYGQEVIFIDDYAHHPTAIKTTLAGYREFYKNHKIIVDFMSHTYTRTEALLEDFASSFSSADKVIINKIYGSARENSSMSSVSGKTLVDCAKKYHKDVVYAKEFDEAAKIGLEYLSCKPEPQYSDGYIFVTMGAGDNWKVGTKILEKLRGTK